MDTPHPADKPSGKRVWLTALLTIGVLLGVGLWISAAWKARHPATAESEDRPRPKPADPRLTFATPYRNVHPEIEYVGSAACASCHPTESRRFQKHPMGRSAAFVGGAEPGERYDASTKDPFAALGFEFLAQPRGQHVVHKEIRRDAQHQVVTELEADVLMAIGSGTQGRSYVINRDGYLYQSPISWFTDSHSWGLSPGFGETALHFRRTITIQCLFCHIDQVTPVAHTNQRYATPLPRQLAIGCERCHGPGRLHVQRREAGEAVAGVDDTIVNPAHLEPSLREAVCQQCHLLGEERIARRGRSIFDYRPGLPLHEVFSPFVRPAALVEGRNTVSHVEGMYLSRCFQASAGPKQLGCISCHDPHQVPAPADREVFYRQRCLGCHEILPSGGVASKGAKQDSLAALSLTPHHSPTDNCIACHMPRRSSANVAHAAITDHRVVRRPTRPGEVAPPSRSGAQSAELPLVYFYRDVHDPQDPEVLRDLGLALINLAPAQGSEDVRRQMCARAMPLLDAAVQKDPDDIDALEAKGFGLWLRDNPRMALGIFDSVLAKVPQREFSREKAARIAMELGQNETAIAHWRRLLAVNPWNPTDHYLLAKLLAQDNDWPAAMVELRASLRLDPNQVAARVLLIAGYFETGNLKSARREFELVERLQPPQIEKLREWFQEQERRVATLDGSQRGS